MLFVWLWIWMLDLTTIFDCCICLLGLLVWVCLVIDLLTFRLLVT